ncbi:hypothetical protein JCM8202_005063 [Rhodotorula sphaerocarpa]
MSDPAVAAGAAAGGQGGGAGAAGASSADRPGAGTTAATTDVRKRTVLPSTLQNVRAPGQPQLELPSDAYLDREEEELNRRVDAHVEQLVDGMKDLVQLAQIDPANPPHPSASSHRSLAVELKTQQMLGSAHSLLGLAHTLKLLHLFGDEAAGVETRARRTAALRAEIAQLKARLQELGQDA